MMGLCAAFEVTRLDDIACLFQSTTLPLGLKDHILKNSYLKIPPIPILGRHVRLSDHQVHDNCNPHSQP